MVPSDIRGVIDVAVDQGSRVSTSASPWDDRLLFATVALLLVGVAVWGVVYFLNRDR